MPNLKFKESIQEAIKSVPLKENDLIINYRLFVFKWRIFKFKLNIFF